MGSFEVRWRRSALRDIKKIAKVDRDGARRIRGVITGLADDLFPPNSRKLTASAAYRLRVGSYRVFYTIDGRAHVVVIEEISPRRDAY